MIIPVDSFAYNVWTVAITHLSVYTSLVYAYFQAFGYPKFGTTNFWLMYFFEFIFVIDFFSQFFQEYKPED